MNPKQIAAERAVSYIQDGMTVGLGTGSTAAYAIHALGRRFQAESLQLRCIATSVDSEELGRSYGLSFASFETVPYFDITIDGADEVDPEFRLIKGAGGALVREKIVAAATRTEIIWWMRARSETRLVHALCRSQSFPMPGSGHRPPSRAVSVLPRPAAACPVPWSLSPVMTACIF